MFDERLRPAQIQHRGTERLQRPDHFFAVIHRPRVAADDGDHRLPAQFGRDVGDRGGAAVHDHRHQFVRCLSGPVAVETQYLRRSGPGPEDRPGHDNRTDSAQPELELGDDSEVAAAPADSPEQIRVLGGTRPHEVTASGNHVHRQQLVDGEPVLAHQPAQAAAEGQAGDTGMGHNPRRRREPVPLRGAVKIAEQRPGLHARRASFGINPDAVHQRQVDDKSVVADGVPGEAVPAAADGHQDIVPPCEANCGRHVVSFGTARDQARVSADRAVPHPSRLVVGLVARSNQLAVQVFREVVDRALIDVDASAADRRQQGHGAGLFAS